MPKLGGGRDRIRPERVLADKAYSSRGNRSWLRRHGIKVTVRPGHPPARPSRRVTARLRQSCLPGPQRCRARHHPAQTVSGRGHSLRQTRSPLPGRPQHFDTSHWRQALDSRLQSPDRIRACRRNRKGCNSYGSIETVGMAPVATAPAR
ncbi:hypothetical protein [Nocardia callitridis]|uniref:hypothetical protein n=1 Tax=Nocardia callitridis TaxID=648753 RepID=UPI003CD09D64